MKARENMDLPKRLGKLVSILLVLGICVFSIQLEQHQQCAFFSWDEEGEIPVENQVDRRVFNLDNELLGETAFDAVRGNLERPSSNNKRPGVQRGMFVGVTPVLCMDQVYTVQNFLIRSRMSRHLDTHRFIISYIYHQNGEKHPDSPYFPV